LKSRPVRCSNILYDKNGVPITDPLIGHSCLTENYAKALWPGLTTFDTSLFKKVSI